MSVTEAQAPAPTAAPAPCSECPSSKPLPHCHAVNPKRGNKLCGQPAGFATSHPGVGPCKRHGGEFPSHKKHAATVMAQAKADELTARLVDRLGAGERPNIGPAESMAVMLELGHQLVEWLRDDVLPAAGAIDGGQPSPWLERLARQVSEQMAAATRAAQIGIEERLAGVAERELDAIELAVAAVLRSRGLEVGDVRADLARELRAIDVASTETDAA